MEGIVVATSSAFEAIRNRSCSSPWSWRNVAGHPGRLPGPRRHGVRHPDSAQDQAKAIDIALVLIVVLILIQSGTLLVALVVVGCAGPDWHRYLGFANNVHNPTECSLLIRLSDM